MRTIKFRGIDAVTGKYVYGYYCPYRGNKNLPGIEIEAGFVEIEPESVSQLIGLDKNGREVYEGDKVIWITYTDDEGNLQEVLEALPMEATFEDIAAIRDGEVVKCVR